MNLTMALVSAAVVMVVVGGVAQGMPLSPEPRQFVFQPGSPSVRLYPVHFELYLKSSPGHVQLMRAGSPVLQALRPNMLQPKTGKTERPSTTGERLLTTTTTTIMMPHMDMKSTTTTPPPPTTTTTTTTPSTITTSEPKRVSMITLEPMELMNIVTTLQPQTATEISEDTVLEPHRDTLSHHHNLEDMESVTEAEMMLIGDSSPLPNDGEELASVTEIMPVMLDEEVEVEAATDISLLPRDESEIDATMTESVPENEAVTELSNFRELEAF